MTTLEHPFELALSVLAEDIAFELRGSGPLLWSDFWLNPRVIRGSDFLMRLSQGAWSEERMKQAVNETDRYHALAYGPSSVAPDKEDVRAYELYFERLEKAGLGKMKRPDLLIFEKSDEIAVNELVEQLGGLVELPFTSEDNAAMQEILSRAILAIECENSLWKARQMPDYGKPLKPMRRLGGRLGLAKSAKLPNVIIKEQDRVPLTTWQQQSGIPIHVWQGFYDEAYGISLDRAMELVDTGLIQTTVGIYQAPGGATTRKLIYYIYPHYGYPLGVAVEEPKLVADSITDKNGHIMPYVRFEGGWLELSTAAIAVLDDVAGSR